MDRFVKGAVLGQGSFGRAILCTSKADGKKYVIKEIDVSRIPRAEKEAAMQEVKVLQSLKHPNIVACYESFIDDGKLCIVMEWCSEGDLYNILKKRRGQLLPEETIIDWFVQICLAMKHVHDRKILHRDLKTQNIFVSSSGLLKLGDFGVAKVLSGTAVLASTAVGTPYYLSPEICQNRKYNHKSDVWSLGCVLYEITTLRHAFDANSLQLLIHKIVKGQFPPVSPKYSKNLRDIVNKMIRTNPTERPSVNQLLQESVLKARIESFLSQSVMAHEFAHTVIHGRPGPGQLVPQFRQVGGAAAAAAIPPHAPSSRPAPSPGPSRAASPLPAADRRAATPPRAVTPEARRPAAPASPAPPAAAPTAAAAAAVNNANQAWRVQHEGELRRLEEERRKIEDERKKLEEARKRKAEDDKRRAAEEERRRKIEEQKRILEEAKKRDEMEKKRRAEELDAKRRLEEERRRLEAEQVAQKKAEDKERRERERQAEKERMEAQRKEWAARQAEAQRNRDKASDQLYGEVGVSVFVPRKDPPPPSGAAPAASPAPGYFASPAPPVPRSPARLSRPSAPSARALADPSMDADVIAAPPGVRRQSSAGAGDPLADERRRIWEEQRAAALANKARFHEGDRAPAAEPPGPSLRDERRNVQLQQPSPVGAAAPAGTEIPADYRRAAWEEMRAAAERNKRRFMDGDGPSAPSPPRSNGPSGRQTPERVASPVSAGDAYLDALRAEQRRIREEAMRNRNRALEAERAAPAAAHPAPSAARSSGALLPAPSPPRSPRTDAMEDDQRIREELARLPLAERKIRMQELQNQRRERELKEYQMRNWREMKAAAERNRNQVLGELGKPSQVHEALVAQGQAQSEALAGGGRNTPSQGPSPRPSPRDDAADEHDASEYGRMLLEMRDVYLNIDADADDGFDDDDAPAVRAASPFRAASPSPAAARAAQSATPSKQRSPSPGPRAAAPPAAAARNVASGSPSADSASLATRIEELRVFLEQKLGFDTFVRAYQRLEALSPEDDEVTAFTDLVGILGRDNVHYLQYIHQLITVESMLSAPSS